MYMKAPTTEGEHFSAKLYKRVSQVLIRDKNISGEKEETLQDAMFYPNVDELYSIS